LTYIIAEAPEGMYLIDQHAAHERITYERLMAQHGAGAVESQGLLLPRSLALPADAVELLLHNREHLAEWGFELDAWGEGMVRLRAVPATLPAEQIQSALLELVEHLAGRGGSTPVNWREAMLITLSCHTSVRAGQTLSTDEMRQLLRQLEHCVSPRTCPHGRPTMILMTPSQLERQFGRRA
jgi:DNA mismatch repair protein MutL